MTHRSRRALRSRKGKHFVYLSLDIAKAGDTTLACGNNDCRTRNFNQRSRASFSSVADSQDRGQPLILCGRWRKNLGVSPGFLSQVMSGKKKLSLTRAVQFSQVLKFEKDEVDDLIRAVTISSAKNPETQTALKKLLTTKKSKARSFKIAELEKFKALQSLVSHRDFGFDGNRRFRSPSFMDCQTFEDFFPASRRSIVSPARVGFISSRRNTWKKSGLLFGLLCTRDSRAAFCEYHKQVIEKPFTIRRCTP